MLLKLISGVQSLEYTMMIAPLNCSTFAVLTCVKVHLKGTRQTDGQTDKDSFKISMCVTILFARALSLVHSLDLLVTAQINALKILPQLIVSGHEQRS